MSLPLAPPTLKGVIVGLDALANGLFQVSLLHTLDPQVLEAKASGISSVSPAEPLLAAPLSSSQVYASHCAAMKPAPSLPISKSLRDLAHGSL